MLEAIKELRRMMYHPTLEEVKAQADQGNLIPVYRSINADLETPVSAYLKVARPPYSFLLESVAGGERIGRYSFIGTEPYRVLKTGPGEEFGEVDPPDAGPGGDGPIPVDSPARIAPFPRRRGRLPGL